MSNIMTYAEIIKVLSFPTVTFLQGTEDPAKAEASGLHFSINAVHYVITINNGLCFLNLPKQIMIPFITAQRHSTDVRFDGFSGVITGFLNCDPNLELLGYTG